MDLQPQTDQTSLDQTSLDQTSLDNTARSDAAISDNATASAYQDAIDRARTDRVVATQTKVAIADSVSNLKNSRDNLVEIFKAAAIVAYPGVGALLASRNILMNLPAEHPVQQLWSKYGQKIDQIDTKIAQQTNAFADQTAKETDAQSAIDSISAEYESFAADTTTPLPPASQLSPDQGAPGLPYTPMMGPAENADLFSQVIGMEFIHPSVQKWIFYSYQRAAGLPYPEVQPTDQFITSVDASMAIQDTGMAVSTLNPSVQLAISPAAPQSTSPLPGLQAPQVSLPVPSATFFPRPTTPAQQLMVAGGILVALFYIFGGSKS
jgi:hypothetical protein